MLRRLRRQIILIKEGKLRKSFIPIVGLMILTAPFMAMAGNHTGLYPVMSAGNRSGVNWIR